MLREKLCELTLCNGELSATMPVGSATELCEQCHEIDWFRLPECEIVGEPDFGRERAACCFPATWESLGPDHISGAVRSIVIDPTNTRRLYAVSASGGVWRLEDVTLYPGARRWAPLTDSLERLRFRRLAVAPGDSAILYAANSRKDLLIEPIGVRSEVFQSTNRGTSWHPIHSEELGTVHRLVVELENARRVFAATSTGLWRWGGTPGLWKRLRAGDHLDVALDPADSRVMYLGERAVGIVKSTDGGVTWSATVLAYSAARAGNREIIQIALGRRRDTTPETAAGRTVVVRFGDEFRVSQNGGTTWSPSRPGNNSKDDLFGGQDTRSNTDLVGRASGATPSPSIPSTRITCSRAGKASSKLFDAGRSWSRVSRPHEDIQDIAFNPVTPGLVYHASDGGIFSSLSGGTVWPTMSRADVFEVSPKGRNLALGLVTGEFRHAAVANGRCLGAIDHTGFVYTPSVGGRWQFLLSGPSSDRHAHESSVTFACPASADRYYIFDIANGMALTQVDLAPAGAFVTATFTPLAADPALRSVPEAHDLDTTYKVEGGMFIGGFPGPFAARFFTGADRRLLIYSTAQVGDRFQVVSLTLPRDGTEVAQGPTTDLSNPDRAYSAIAFSETRRDRAYVMETQGRLWSRDYLVPGSSFAELGSWALPAGCLFVSMIVPSPLLWAPALFALSQRAIGRSLDGGSTWQTIFEWTGDGESLLALLAHPSQPDCLFLGTTHGLHLSRDAGHTWNEYTVNLARVPVIELFFDDGFVYAATYGRGLWRLRPCDG